MAGKPVGEAMGLKVARNIWGKLIHMTKNLPKYWLEKTKENLVVCTHPFLMLEPPIKSSKRERLDRISTFRGGCWKREGLNFFREGGCNFHIKNN